jgi:threonine dehydrogenase-like Zn-dependent dehydrogenase
MGVQRGLEVHVLDRNRGGVKEALVRELGGTFHVGDIDSMSKPDIVMECTGAAAVIQRLLGATAPAGIVCLLGVSVSGKAFDLDIGLLNRTLVLDNDTVFGAVNANRRHYDMAAAALAQADKGWLARLITRRVPLARWSEALEHRQGDIKVIVDFAA